MPHLRFRAIEPDQVKNLSDTLVDPLAKAMNTTPDNFTFEHIPSQFFYKKKETAAYPLVEVLWFSRGKEVQQRAADIITNQVKAITQAQDVVVLFVALPESCYFENGQHF